MNPFVGTLLVPLAAGVSMALGQYLHRAFGTPGTGPVAPGRYRTLTHRAFCSLAHDERLLTVQHEGTFLARRHAGSDIIELYHLPGNFFCELHADLESHDFKRMSTFTGSQYLDEYLDGIHLPGLAD